MPGPRRTRKTGGRKPPLGKQGQRVSSQIIRGRETAIRDLVSILRKTSDPTQKILLAEQIKLERASLAEFKRKTQ